MKPCFSVTRHVFIKVKQKSVSTDCNRENMKTRQVWSHLVKGKEDRFRKKKRTDSRTTQSDIPHPSEGDKKTKNVLENGWRMRTLVC